MLHSGELMQFQHVQRPEATPVTQRKYPRSLGPDLSPPSYLVQIPFCPCFLLATTSLSFPLHSSHHRLSFSSSSVCYYCSI
ncbi:uncharacterized protein DS421_1g12230 [Arachis hypogaea]|nr:uncharacterized protein DS421_1g12230 [Arachis hypogaea]